MPITGFHDESTFLVKHEPHAAGPLEIELDRQTHEAVRFTLRDIGVNAAGPDLQVRNRTTIRLNEIVTNEEGCARLYTSWPLKNSTDKNLSQEFKIAGEKARAPRIVEHHPEPDAVDREIDRWSIVAPAIEKIKDSGHILEFVAAFGEDLSGRF